MMRERKGVVGKGMEEGWMGVEMELGGVECVWEL